MKEWKKVKKRLIVVSGTKQLRKIVRLYKKKKTVHRPPHIPFQIRFLGQNALI